MYGFYKYEMDHLLNIQTTPGYLVLDNIYEIAINFNLNEYNKSHMKLALKSDYLMSQYLGNYISISDNQIDLGNQIIILLPTNSLV